MQRSGFKLFLWREINHYYGGFYFMDSQQNQNNFQEPGYQNFRNQRNNSDLKPLYYLLIGCGSLGAIVFIGFIGLIVWFASGPDSGVKLSNQIDPYAKKYLKEHKVLDDSEEVVAYYDETVSMDGTKAVILTSKRIISHVEGSNTSIDLKDIDDIQHTEEPITGDIYVITSTNGKSIKFEIAPLNQADAFTTVLMKSWNAVKQKK